ncbi:insulin-like growth factor isoform X1 [Aricia agestis]|uniref:insulin-like growth factor isoform X1 n=1 Tax=Aricia agestis TaxID=91739 RepID=UPI001C20163D|nr:insulin-like growth factor isoform X1 [Aricia agestis]XP_041973047.1 insulin-like growth factor isoform X1 [Aricia agestis]
MKQLVQVAVIYLAMVLECEGTSMAFKLCGRDLGDIMTRVCHAYNSPAWDVPTVVEQPASAVRRRRRTGIADECCVYGCTWEQLESYCSVKAKEESPFELMEEHMIADRSAEQAVAAPVAVAEAGAKAAAGAGARREVGRRSRGYGRARGRCWCRRKRRSGRRRTALMGNMGFIKNVVRAAPILGTVSPLLAWGRTLNTDLPTDRDRYAYIAVYT